MGFFSRLFGKKAIPSQGDLPFMEHPTGEFDTAIQAMCSAIRRLDEMGAGGRWITFSGQGQGSRLDSYQIEEVKFNGRTFDLSGETVDLEPILEFSGLADAAMQVETSPEGKITLPNASADQLAHFLDALFRIHFGIKPFEDEGDDYAVGAEW